MAHYRLYFLDATAHIKNGIDAECHDDKEAIEHAKRQELGDGIELWCGTRLVKVFKSPPTSRD